MQEAITPLQWSVYPFVQGTGVCVFRLHLIPPSFPDGKERDGIQEQGTHHLQHLESMKGLLTDSPCSGLDWSFSTSLGLTILAKLPLMQEVLERIHLKREKCTVAHSFRDFRPRSAAPLLLGLQRVSTSWQEHTVEEATHLVVAWK